MGTGLRYPSLVTEHGPRQTPRARQPGVFFDPDAGPQPSEDSVIAAPPLLETRPTVDPAPVARPPQPAPQSPVTPQPPAATLTQAETDDAIGKLRVEIDDLDAALVRLVTRRIEVSKEVGRLRMAAGGTRLALAREQAVVARFSAELGETGTSLAMLLLRAGRGRI